jgi:DNA-binding transcriptional MocR family regulator
MATVVQDLEASQKRCLELEAAQAASADALKVKDQAIEAGVKALADEKAISAKAQEAITAGVDALKAEQDAHAATKAQLELAQKQLANPAHLAVKNQGSQAAVPEGGSQATETKTQAEWRAEHNEIKDPVAQAQFRGEHRKELGLK